MNGASMSLRNEQGGVGLVIVVVLGVLMMIGFGLYGYANGVRNTGIAFEEQISAQYEDNQNELSKMISTFYETTGLANLKSAKMDTILTHAIQGRYGEDGFSADGAFFSAVHEAYPDLAGLNIYDKIVDQVTANRAAFAAKQTALRDQIREFNTWRRSGIVRSIFVGNFFPSENLEARVGGQTLATGSEALRKMSDMIVTGSAVNAYSTGVMEPMSVNPR